MSDRTSSGRKRVHGELPETELSGPERLQTSGEGLVPLRMEPPAFQDGLDVIRFTEGLDQLTLEAIRSGGRPKAVNEESRRLAEARARAAEFVRLE